MLSFEEKLAMGKTVESLVARWLVSQGYSVLPAPEVNGNGKGPRLLTPAGDLIAPDLLVISSDGSLRWIEVKYKTAASWAYTKRYWCTGIDILHFEDYQRVQEALDYPVWVYFVHGSTKPSKEDLNNGSPLECETGIWRASISRLIGSISHSSDKTGLHYWNLEALHKLAPIDVL